jgi:hypothetical protein
MARPKLRPGQIVVVLSRYMRGGVLPIAARRFVCSHGAGMDPFQPGTGIWGTWESSGEADRIEVHMLDLSAVNGSGHEDALTEVEATLRRLRE